METEVTQTPETEQNTKLDALWAEVSQRQRAIEMATRKKVVPIVIREIGKVDGYVVGFMYRPDLITQLRLSDKGQAYASGFSQEEASRVLQTLLITAESDPRINMETEEGELYWKGALLVLYDFVKGAIPVLKKN